MTEPTFREVATLSDRHRIRFAFDLDATVTRTEILPAIANAHFDADQARDIRDQTLASQAGIVDYEHSMRQRFAALATLPLEQIHRIVAEIPLHDALVQWIQRNADRCLLVTHNLAAWIQPIAQRLGCAVHGSTPKMLGDAIIGLESTLDKAKVIDTLVGQGHQLIAVGDGVNDVGMLKAAHWGIAWGSVHEPPAPLLEAAQERIDDEHVLCRRLDELSKRSPHAFLSQPLQGVYQAIESRRDVRHFLPGPPLDLTTRTRLEHAFYQAPNVGLMQGAAIIRIANKQLRDDLHRIVQQEQQETAKAYQAQDGNDRAQQFLELKTEGIQSCAELWVVALRDGRESEIFGRRTLPHMDLASAACGIQNIWLAARAEGLGMGWVSLFCPDAVARCLELPSGAQAIAMLCIGPTEQFHDQPQLVRDGWRQAKPIESMLFENRWGQAPVSKDSGPSPTPSALEAVRGQRTELILGGARSGKSAHAESIANSSGLEKIYIATARVTDEEMQARITLHQRRRGPAWSTHHAPIELAATLAELDRPDRVILVDCLTLWLSQCLFENHWPEQKIALLERLPQLTARVLLVSNEVGQGVVPMGRPTREFVDESGWLHQALAQACARTTKVTAGIAQRLR